LPKLNSPPSDTGRSDLQSYTQRLGSFIGAKEFDNLRILPLLMSILNGESDKEILNKVAKAAAEYAPLLCLLPSGPTAMGGRYGQFPDNEQKICRWCVKGGAWASHCLENTGCKDGKPYHSLKRREEDNTDVTDSNA
jgi:hypothetical protein